MKVSILGASGNTGQSIVKGLLTSSTPFEITALARPSSLDGPKSQALRDDGIAVVAADLAGPEEDLVAVLRGTDVLISAIVAFALEDQIPLANAAKKAGVGRFVPCSFGTASPPRGVMALAEAKDDVLAHVKTLHLPYTVIDVGWWYQITPPRVPSGRLDGALFAPAAEIFGDGAVPSAITHIDDIGPFVARIIADDRTLNRSVFAYGAVKTQNEVWDLVERLSGEKLERKYVSTNDLDKRISAAREAFAAAPKGIQERVELFTSQYALSRCVRGDNTPEIAKYLGYLDARELYPDFEPIRFEDFLSKAL